MKDLKPYAATVSIRYVQETVTKGGLRRFTIGAERDGTTLAERYLSFTTLNAWKASLCSQAKDQGFQLSVKYRDTGFFDADLLFVEMAGSR